MTSKLQSENIKDTNQNEDVANWGEYTTYNMWEFSEIVKYRKPLK